MKTTNTLKVSLSIFFLFLSVFLFGQKRYSLSLQIKQGVTGFEKSEKQSTNFVESSSKVIPGGSFSIGIDNHYYFFNKKYPSISGGILWNYYSFSKKIDFHTNSFMGIPANDFILNYRFKSHSIIFPLNINPRINKIGFSIGIIPRYHVNTELVFEKGEVNVGAPQTTKWSTQTYEDGDFTQLAIGGNQRVELERKVDLQYSFGINLFLNDKLSVEIGYKDLFFSNNLKIEVNSILDGAWIPGSEHDVNSKTISVGLRWIIL